MIWSIVFFTSIFVIIGIIGSFGSKSHELSEYQLQELERIKSNGIPPGDGSS